jgi:hypothetical protein
VKPLHDDMHVLTGSYVLDALSDLEREDLERHLHHCPPCEAEVRGLHETAARLAMATTVQPPAQLEQRVLAATYRTRQLPPLASQRFRRGRWRAAVAGAARLVADRLETYQPRPGLRDRRGHSWVRSPRLVGLLAAASVAATVVLGISLVSTQHRLDSVQANAAAIATVVDAPDARIETLHTARSGAVTVVVSAEQREAVVTTSGMPSLPASRVYQVWVIDSAGARSAGLLAHATHVSQLLASGVRAGDRIGITVEPADGTTRPTTTPVIVIPLTA